MSFTNPAPLGGYLTGDVIDESEINYWCAALPDCVDGAGGGTYTLSNPLVFEGDVVEIEDLETDTLDVTGGTSLGGTLSVTGFTSLANNLNVTGTTTLYGSVNVGTDTADLVDVRGIMSFLSGGRYLVTSQVVSTASSSVDITQKRFITFTGALTTTTLTATGAVDGDWFVMYNNSASTQATSGIVTTSLNFKDGVMYIRTGGSWYLASKWAAA